MVFLITVIAIAVATWFFLNQINDVKITGFSVAKSYYNRGGLAMVSFFNITLHNMGINDVYGLTLVVKWLRNDSEIQVRPIVFGTMNDSEHEQFSDPLRAGSSRD